MPVKEGLLKVAADLAATGDTLTKPKKVLGGADIPPVAGTYAEFVTEIRNRAGNDAAGNAHIPSSLSPPLDDLLHWVFTHHGGLSAEQVQEKMKWMASDPHALYWGPWISP